MSRTKKYSNKNFSLEYEDVVVNTKTSSSQYSAEPCCGGGCDGNSDPGPADCFYHPER